LQIESLFHFVSFFDLIIGLLTNNEHEDKIWTEIEAFFIEEYKCSN
jgi:hypothetical protein